MEYAPAALRFDYGPDVPSECTSALYIATRNTPGLFISVSPLLQTVDAKTKICGVVPDFIHKNAVDWAPVDLVRTVELKSMTALLQSLASQYDLDPSGHESEEDKPAFLATMSASIYVLQFSNNKQRAVTTTTVDLSTVDHGSSPRKIVVESAPFALVNPALFLEYLSWGTVAYVARRRNSRQPVAIFSDITFLEGMEGGAVFHDDGSQSRPSRLTGLVLGSLRKKSRHGKLTVIVPVDTLLETELATVFGYSMGALLPAPSQLLSPPAPKATSRDFGGVVAIIVTGLRNVRIWGSGILLDPHTIVTNQHVIGENPSRITAWFNSSLQASLSVISTPIKGVDMVFLRVTSESSPSIVSPNKFKPLVPSSSKPLAGDKVTSIGYGLFYPHGMGDVEPLYAHGIVSKAFFMPLLDKQPRGTPKPPSIAMLITSAHCWNGSSGGAVVSSADPHQLVGMMASNGRSHRADEFIPTMAFVIPSHLIAYGWELVKSGKTVVATSRVRQLWSLQPTHHSRTSRL